MRASRSITVFAFLALETSAAFLERDIVVDQNISEINFLNPATQQISNTFAISEVNPVHGEQPACPAIGKQDISASGIIDESADSQGIYNRNIDMS